MIVEIVGEVSVVLEMRLRISVCIPDTAVSSSGSLFMLNVCFAFTIKF